MTSDDKGFTIQGGKELRLSVGPHRLAYASPRIGGDAWAVHTLTRDLDGRTMPGGGEVASRADARRRLAELGPSLVAMDRAHNDVASALSAALGPLAFGDRPFSAYAGSVSIPATTFVRLLARAARGDTELEAMLRGAPHDECAAAANAIAGARHDFEALVGRHQSAAVERLVATLPRPSLAPLRETVAAGAVPPGSLVVLPIERDHPEDAFVLALHLPDGRGFMFTFGQLADPCAEDLRDPERLWPWAETDDAPTTVLARGLDDGGVLAVLGLDGTEVRHAERGGSR